MALINLNDTTPPPPSGKVNISWQADSGSPRNVSAYIDLPPSGAGSGALTGTLDGVNKTFDLSFAPNPVASLQLVLHGLTQIPGIDFTITGAVITYSVAPHATDFHYAWYSH